ncbi:MAG: hypothetical protein R2694_15245 [Ilumatobacteraceae bacterium]
MICLLCQGAFGLMTASSEDEVVLVSMARALRPVVEAGAQRVQRLLRREVLRHAGDGAEFDADSGVNEHTEVRNEQGEPRVDL